MDWAWGGAFVGHGLGTTSYKTQYCPQFIHVKVLSKICLFGDRRVIGCWLHMMKSKLCRNFVLVHSLAGGDYGVGLDCALGGPGLGFGWAWTGSWASQVAKSSLCPEFIHVQVLTKVCLIGDRRVIGCWSHMMKSKLCPDFILVHSLAWCDSGVGLD